MPWMEVTPFPSFESTTMPFTAAQIAQGANYTLETFRRNAPIDNININHVLLKWFMDNKAVSVFGNGFYNESVFVSNDSNYQNYFGADQVTYNSRDPVRQAKYTYANYHDGFWFDEDRLKANNIVISEDGMDPATTSEKEQLVNLLEVSFTALQKGIQDGLALETLQSGAQSAKAVVGLDALVSTTPTVGTVGNIDASVATYWRNNTNLAISTGTVGNVSNGMDAMWDNCVRYGGRLPNKIVCGYAFYTALKNEARTQTTRELSGGGVAQGGVTYDVATKGLYYRGIPVEWDPTFEQLDAVVGAITYPWTKRCYFLNSDVIKFRPMKGAWDVKRKPQRLPDRYVLYFGNTGSYGMTTNQRNATGVLSIA